MICKFCVMLSFKYLCAGHLANSREEKHTFCLIGIKSVNLTTLTIGKANYVQLQFEI